MDKYDQKLLKTQALNWEYEAGDKLLQKNNWYTEVLRCISNAGIVPQKFKNVEKIEIDSIRVCLLGYSCT